MSGLRARARRFLRRPLPPGEEAEGNATIGLITRYADGGTLSDSLVRRLAAACAAALRKGSPEMADEQRAYYTEAAAILQKILDETGGKRRAKGKAKGTGGGTLREKKGEDPVR